MAQYADFDAWLTAIRERAIPMGLALTEDTHDQGILNQVDLVLLRLKRDRAERAAKTPYTIDESKQGTLLDHTTPVRYQGVPCPGCGLSVIEIEGQLVHVDVDGWLGKTHHCPEGARKR